MVESFRVEGDRVAGGTEGQMVSAKRMEGWTVGGLRGRL